MGHLWFFDFLIIISRCIFLVVSQMAISPMQCFVTIQNMIFGKDELQCRIQEAGIKWSLLKVCSLAPSWQILQSLPKIGPAYAPEICQLGFNSLAPFELNSVAIILI